VLGASAEALEAMFGRNEHPIAGRPEAYLDFGQESGIVLRSTIGHCHDLEQVTVRIVEVDAATAIIVVDHARLGSAWIGPEVELVGLDPAEDLVEFRFRYQKCQVLLGDGTIDLEEIERDLIV
jgi:hypothetical protein